MQRDFEMRFLAAFGLALIDSEHSVVDVMRAHLDHIAAALAGVEDQREGKPRLGADRIRRLECRDLGLDFTIKYAIVAHTELGSAYAERIFWLLVNMLDANHLSGSRAGVVGIYQRHDWAEFFTQACGF